MSGNPLYTDTRPYEPPTAEELEAWCKLDPNSLGPVGALSRCARRVRDLEAKDEAVREAITGGASIDVIRRAAALPPPDDSATGDGAG